MDFDKLVKEWFYRLPKGYADAPYSQEELAVLDEVMTEQGVSLPEAELEKEKFTEPDQMRNEVDQLDQAFNNAEPVDDEEDEIVVKVDEAIDSYDLLLNEGYTKDDLIAVIQQTPLPDKLIAYISRLIDSSVSQTSVIKNLEQRRFDADSSKSMFDKAVEMDSYKQLQDLVAGNAQSIDFDSLGDSGNLQSFIDKVGFTKEYVDWLYNYRPAIGGVNVGAGESETW